MAGPLPCDNHPDRMATMLMTNLENGDTLTLCGECIGAWVATMNQVFNAPEGDEPEPEPVTEEAGQPEAEATPPDPDQKSEPPPAAVIEALAEINAAIGQETETSGE